MAENEVQNNAQDKQEKTSVDMLKDRVSAVISKVAEEGKKTFESVKETVVEQGTRAKEYVEEMQRDRRANDIYVRLGKKVYKMVCRDEMTVPECCEKYIAELKELYADVDGDADACECKCGDSCACGDGDACKCDCADKAADGADDSAKA